MWPVTDIECGHEAGNFFAVDQPAVDAQQPIGLRAFAQRGDPALRVSNGKMALLREHDVVIKLERQAFVELDALVIKRHTLRRAIVGANDGRVPSAGAAAEVSLVEHCDVRDAAFAEVVGNSQTMDAGADDDDVVGGFQVMAAPHAFYRHERSVRLDQKGSRFIQCVRTYRKCYYATSNRLAGLDCCLSGTGRHFWPLSDADIVCHSPCTRRCLRLQATPDPLAQLCKADPTRFFHASSCREDEIVRFRPVVNGLCALKPSPLLLLGPRSE